MKKWRIKEISDLTQTSIRMLRHYDKIGLLQPSYREHNGYRCYTEPDLARLEQIIALKYFGFSLSQIKDILQKNAGIYAHLQAQQQVIRKEARHLLQVSQVLENILKCRSSSKFPDDNDLLLLIKEYNMTENVRDKLKKTWAGTHLTASQFEDYLFLYEQFPEDFAARDAIIEEINQQKVGGPDGPDGERIAAFIENLAKKMKQVFTEQVKLSSSLLESMKSGQLTQLELTPEGIQWVSRAMTAWSLKRWDNLYNQITENLHAPPEGAHGKKLAEEWRNLINNYLLTGNRDFLVGILFWQEVSRQDYEIKTAQTPLTPQEMVKPWHIKLLFNPEASAWISKALEAHE